jgi:hypothetical protein
MTIYALAKLHHRSEQMTVKLAFGTKTEIAAARELLRQSLIELYELGYWLQHPEDMRKYMRLYRICGPEYRPGVISSRMESSGDLKITASQ